TEAIAASGEEATAEYMTRAIKAAVRFDKLALPPDVARQFLLLKIAQGMPAPSDPQERSELAAVQRAMAGEYGKGHYCPARLKGSCIKIDDPPRPLATSRKYDELLEAWTGWHSISPPYKERFARYVELGNKGAKEIGFGDMGALWRAGYDMPAEAF